MGLFASSTSWTGPNHAWEVRIYDLTDATDPDHDLKIVGAPVRRVGKLNAEDPLDPVRASSVELRALDVGRVLFDRLNSKDERSFRGELRRDGLKYLVGPVYLESDVTQIGVADPVIPVTIYDGLGALRAESVEVTGQKDIITWMNKALTPASALGVSVYDGWTPMSEQNLLDDGGFESGNEGEGNRVGFFPEPGATMMIVNSVAEALSGSFSLSIERTGVSAAFAEIRYEPVLEPDTTYTFTLHARAETVGVHDEFRLQVYDNQSTDVGARFFNETRTFDTGGAWEDVQWTFTTPASLPDPIQTLRLSSTRSDAAGRIWMDVFRLPGLLPSDGTLSVVMARGQDLRTSQTGAQALPLLETLLRTFALQVVQEDATWTVVQRSERLKDSLDGHDEAGQSLARDFRVTIDDSHIIDDNPVSDPLPAAGRVQVHWTFVQMGTDNMDFSDLLTGWDQTGVQYERQDNGVAIVHNSTGDSIQREFEVRPRLVEGMNVLMYGTLSDTGGTPPNQPCLQILWHDAVDGQTYWRDVDAGTGWSTTETTLEADPGAITNRIIANGVFTLPGSGEGWFEVRTAFDPDPDNDSVNEYINMGVFSIRLSVAAAGGDGIPGVVEYVGATHTWSGDGGRDVIVHTPLGGLHPENGRQGVLMNRDVGGFVVRPRDWDGTVSGIQRFGEVLVRDIAGQQAKNLQGINVWLGPNAPNVPAAATVVYQGTRYAQAYQEEVIGEGRRRVVAYEVRMDAPDFADIETVFETAQPPGAVPSQGPTARFSFEVTENTVNVDAGTSQPGDAPIVQYDWDWGDGTQTPDGGVTAQHVYANQQTFLVVLTVTDNNTNTDTETKNVTTDGINPVAEFTVSDEGANLIGVDASASSDTDGTIVRYDWDWGDGTETLNGDVTELHQYSGPGTFGIVLTVTDDDGNTDTQSHPATAD